VEERFRAVRYALGVTSVLSVPEVGPIEVDKAIITAIRERSLNGYIEIQTPPLLPGEELEIIEGPFQGLTALFQQELKAGERVAVLLDLLSSRVRVELPRACVQKRSVAHSRPLAG